MMTLSYNLPPQFQHFGARGSFLASQKGQMTKIFASGVMVFEGRCFDKKYIPTAPAPVKVKIGLAWLHNVIGHSSSFLIYRPYGKGISLYTKIWIKT